MFSPARKPRLHKPKTIKAPLRKRMKAHVSRVWKLYTGWLALVAAACPDVVLDILDWVTQTNWQDNSTPKVLRILFGMLSLYAFVSHHRKAATPPS